MDIVERLREQRDREDAHASFCKSLMAENGAPYPCSFDCPCALREMVIEKADEITRLRAEVERMRMALDVADQGGPWRFWSDKAQTLALENLRLREALDYRTSLNRVTYDDDGHLDEIVTDGGAHLEHMGDDSWFMNLWRGDGTGVALWFTGKVTSIEFEDAVLCPACSKRPLLIDNGLLACECGWSARAALHEGRQDAEKGLTMAWPHRYDMPASMLVVGFVAGMTVGTALVGWGIWGAGKNAGRLQSAVTDIGLQIDLKTCAGLLEEGLLSHSSQQRICAERIRAALHEGREDADGD